MAGWATAGRVGHVRRTQGHRESPRDVCVPFPHHQPSLCSLGNWSSWIAALASVLFSCCSGVTGRTRFWGRSRVPAFMTCVRPHWLFKQTRALPSDGPPPGSSMLRL